MNKYKVLCGADRLESMHSLLSGKRVALLTAASGVDREGVPTYELIKRKYRLDVMFSPEHGIRSNLQDGKFGAEDGAVDSETGAVMYGLTSKGHPRLDAILSDIDIVVYDIQDVGARFYTYLCNLTQIMRACKRVGIPVLVLDRPAMCDGFTLEGAVLDESEFSSFIGEFSVPTRYGMTVGEYASFVNVEKKIGCELHVLRCEGWKREMYYDETDLLFVNPSPNIPSVNSVFNYYGACLYEATNISEGRGTTRPFDIIGAPFVDSKSLYEEMVSYNLPGVVFRRVYFVPQFNKHAGEVCEGLELHVTDRKEYLPILTHMYMLRHFRRYKEYNENETGLCMRFGNRSILGDIEPKKIECENNAKIQEFLRIREKYVLY